jgi:hypothetical protein
MKRLLVSLVLVLCASAAAARIISYAPYTDRLTHIGFQSRSTRHFLIVEQPSGSQQTSVVLHDSQGGEEPRVVFQMSGDRIFWAAMWEDEREVPAILIAHSDGNNYYGTQSVFKFSNDGGRTLKTCALPRSAFGAATTTSYIDNGGPYTRGRHVPVLIGNRDYPFVVQVNNPAEAWVVDANGLAVRWMAASAGSTPNIPNMLLGADATRSRFLIRTGPTTYAMAGFDGSLKTGSLPDNSLAAGWITPDGRVYVELSSPAYIRGVQYTKPHSLHLLDADRTYITSLNQGFAVPSHDYSGAWIIDRGAVTTLLRHTPGKGLEDVWTDAKRPEVEALIAGASGKTLLVQVHRPRPQPDRIVTDPALAVWREGDPAPKDYDELFLAEQPNKGFVHVDVDRMAAGEPFVFDSGIFVPPPPQVIISGGGGGGDILQEWGVVRGSLRARFVLPGVGRALGANGSNWTTDVTLYNPESVPQQVELRFVQSGADGVAVAAQNDTRTVTLNAKEIRVLPDILGSLFGRVGSGALFLTPERGLNAMGRTYTRSARGTYGFGMNAIDVYAAASPGFPVTFSGAFPGASFRTNVTLTDTTGRGSEVGMVASGAPGFIGLKDLSFTVPADGQQQFNGIETTLGVPGSDGGLTIRPKRGFVVASVFAVDNRTNDPTYFPPDLNAAVTRWIPVIGHLDGAHGSQFRTDLYIYNPTAQDRGVVLRYYPWNTNEPSDYRYVYLKPNESRVIRDAYRSLFAKTGLARLEYFSSTTGNVRVMSRTYNVDANGGTYGCLTPPLNGFQMAAPNETLEILGATGDPQYRTNIGIVELNRAGTTDLASARIEIIDERGDRIDEFTVSLRFGAGTQVNDIFRNRVSTPGAALIRVTPIRGHITAYATVTDNQTNDSIYLAPYLAATP